MKVALKIPKEFEIDYNKDKFKDFFDRVIAEINYSLDHNQNLCLLGNYEKETAIMFREALDNAEIVNE